MRLRLLRPRAGAGAALVVLALILASAPGAAAHRVAYDDPSELGMYHDSDIVLATVDHWPSGRPSVGPPPSTLEHTITTRGNFFYFPCVAIAVGTVPYRVCELDPTTPNTADVRRGDGAWTGPAQVFETGSEVTYRFSSSTIGNPSAYQWAATATSLDYLTTPGQTTDLLPDAGFHAHVLRSSLIPSRP